MEEETVSNLDFSTIVKMETDEGDSNNFEVDSKDWQDGSEMSLPEGWSYKTVHGHTAGQS